MSKKKTCAHYRCGKQISKSGLCSKHYLISWRLKNSMKYAFQTLKDNAKRRGKEFAISFEYFSEWAITHDYLIGKGRTSTSATVDRIIEDRGYIEGNLQRLENGQNVQKNLQYRFGSNGKPTDFHVITHRPAQENADVPF
jgi:hypothetical protein